jgi:hypothetical protein
MSMKGILVTAAIAAVVVAAYHNGLLAPVPGFGPKSA